LARAEKNGHTRGGKPRFRRRLLMGWLSVVVLGGLAGGVIYGFVCLDSEVRSLPMYQVDRALLPPIVQGEAWMTPSILADLDIRNQLPARFNLLDPELCRFVARACEQIVWIERVERVEVHDPRVDPTHLPLEVRVTFRRPVAFVEGDHGAYLVDAHGVRLPGVYSEAPRLGQETLLVIRGVNAAPPQPGQPWPGGSVLAGAQVAEAVTPHRHGYRITTVDVSNYGRRRSPDDTEIALYTQNGTRIKWGMAPSARADLLHEELFRKVEYLDYVYQQLGGRVDGVLEYIDVPNKTIRRRAASLTTRLRS